MLFSKNNNKDKITKQNLQLLPAEDTTCRTVSTALTYSDAWLPTEMARLLVSLTLEPLPFREAFTYLELMQNRVMTVHIPESYL